MQALFLSKVWWADMANFVVMEPGVEQVVVLT